MSGGPENADGEVRRGQEALEQALRAKDPVRAVAGALREVWPEAPLCACWLGDPGEALCALDEQGHSLGDRVAAIDRAVRRWCGSRNDLSFGSFRAPRTLPFRGAIHLARLRAGKEFLGGLAVAFPPDFSPEQVASAADLLAGLAGFLSLRIQLDRALAAPDRGGGPGCLPEQAGALGDMLGPVAHELHNLFNGMVLQAAVLAREVPEGLREKVAFFRSQAFRASELLGLLDRYRYTLRPSPVGVRVNEVVESAVARCRGEGIPVECRPGARVPEVLANEEELARLVWLLVRNAHAAMNSSGGTGRVTVQTGRRKGQAVLTVKDSGPRLERDRLATFFEPTAPARGAEEPLERVACRALVERLRGTIRARNLRRGLEVIVELPARGGG
jgi:signal transduction histidine kinase